MVVWCMAAIVLMAGCSASEEITTEPELTSFSHSDCKRYYSPQNIDGRVSVQTRSEEEPPIISLSYSAEGGKLDLYFENMVSFCGVHSANFIAKVEGNVISIAYLLYFKYDLDCMCTYDLDCGLAQLSPGKYTLNIYSMISTPSLMSIPSMGRDNETPVFPDDPKYPKFSEKVDLTKDISISFPYEVRRD